MVDKDQKAKQFSTRVILTTYPGQSTVNPVELVWGEADPIKRGPVIVSRQASTISKRNAIGAHGGSYSTYFALANVCSSSAFTSTLTENMIGCWRYAIRLQTAV